MNTYKVAYITQSGKMKYRVVEAASKSEARKQAGDMVIMDIYKINEVGAIIG